MKNKKMNIGVILFLLFFAGGLGAIIWGVIALSAKPEPQAVPIVKSSIVQSGTPAENHTEATAEPAAPTPLPAALTDWRLTLTNSKTPIADLPDLTLKTLYGSHQVDTRIYADLTALLDACTEAGFSPLVCSAYRTEEEQTELYENQISAYLAKGDTRADAEAKADMAVARPGTSEHQLGLAADIVSLDNQRLDSTQAENPAQVWLMENSWRYGFILRYPEDKEALTMKMYEPWHYRYVGEAYAKEIFESGLCFEEFIESLLEV